MSSITKTIRLSGKAGGNIEDAVRTVLARAATTIADIQRFEMIDHGQGIRGEIGGGRGLQRFGAA